MASTSPAQLFDARAMLAALTQFRHDSEVITPAHATVTMCISDACAGSTSRFVGPRTPETVATLRSWHLTVTETPDGYTVSWG
jgi:hypothetical protein